MASQLDPWAHLTNNKVVLITGASSGIGRELCLDLAGTGCRIVGAARRVDRLESLCEEINLIRGKRAAAAVELDVSSDGMAIEAAVEMAWDAFGAIDVLINNAGVRGILSHKNLSVENIVQSCCLSLHGTVKSPLKLSEEEWSSTLKTNLTGSWLVSKYVGLRMCAANIRGSIINISSSAGLNRGHVPGGVAYATSKVALNTLTKMMALELGQYGIRVNSISPGIFRSEITENLMQKDWVKTVAAKTVPLGTHGTTDPALTSLVRYLIHESSDYISGNIFIVEAGATLPGVPLFSSL